MISVVTESPESNCPSGSWLDIPAWAWMWGIMAGFFLLAKGVVLSGAWRAGVGPFVREPGSGGIRWNRALRWSAAFTLLWPGMEVGEFGGGIGWSQRETDWRGLLGAGAKVGMGACLLWVVARHCRHPLIAGWVGMIGLGFVLHFGLFHMAAILWRRAGLHVGPVMDWPMAARSAGEFWGRRWNRPFNDLAVRFGLRPLARRWGWAAATLVIFLMSGVVHELVISLPARGGWGLPTGYFLIQGLAILGERKFEIHGHVWTLAVVAGPAFWLFHPPFVHRVMLPFFSAIGAVPASIANISP